MNNRRKLVIALGATALAAPFSSLAQQQGKVWRIGFLGASTAAGSESRMEAIREGLRGFGYVEGKNITIEWHWAEGKYDRLPELAAELVRLKVDILLTGATPASRAAKQATSTIPIVMFGLADPVASGLVASLARPGANATGITFFPDELAAKRLELMKYTLPRSKRFAILFNPESPAHMGSTLPAVEAAARLLKVDLLRFGARRQEEIGGAFTEMVRKQVHAAVYIEDPVFNTVLRDIVGLAAKHRLPSIGNIEFAERGGLIGYGVNILDMYRRTGYFVDKILKGANPGDIPVERPRNFELVVNMKTAKALRVTFPQSILPRADRVIE